MGVTSQLGGTSMLSMSKKALLNCLVSIKEDAHDLLEKYSEMLMAAVIKKMNK
jgi:hypothetical protein